MDRFAINETYIDTENTFEIINFSSYQLSAIKNRLHAGLNFCLFRNIDRFQLVEDIHLVA